MTAWAVERTYEVLGVPIRIRSTEPSVEHLLDRLCAGFTPTPREPAADVWMKPLASAFVVGVDEEIQTGPLTRDQAVMALMAGINEQALTRTELWAIHAGVVAREGTVLAFPGASGFGKSTFVSHCLRAGFEYGSDEALCLDRDTLAVVPYAKPIWLTEWTIEHLGLDPGALAVAPDHHKAAVLPADLGAKAASGDLRLGAVVVLERRPGSAEIETVPPASLVKTLFLNTFRSPVSSERRFRDAARVARGIGAFRLRYEDPTEAVAALDGI